MAETLGEFYLRLGLSLADLESDFVDAERTLQQNISRLSRQQNLIQLRADVEIGNLDETADAAQILEVRTRALNEQMAIQRDRIQIAQANLRDLTQRHGENAAVTQRAAQALERERLRLQRFERELRDVERAQRDLNDAQEESTNGAQSFGEALDNIAGKAAGLFAVVEVFNSISESVQETSEKFRELQNQSYELNLPVGQTKAFLRELKLAGGDIGDFEGYIRGISDAYVKGEFDDPEAIALSKYGAKITDATGRLKNFKDITEEVYQAYLKAKDAGEEIEFLQLTGGESGVRDAIQFFERYKEAREDAAKVFNADLDAGAFHKLDRALGLVEEQSNELKQAIADIFAPAITQGAESLFELLHAGTEILTENKEEFKSWGFIAAESINLVLDPLKELKTTLANADDDSFLGAFKHTAKELGKTAILGTPTKLLDDFGAFEGIIDRATEKQIAYNNSIKDTTATWANFRREQEKKTAKSNPLNQYDTTRITQYRDELEDLRLELEYFDDEYNKALAKNDLWLQRGLTRPNFLSPDEENVLRELHAAQREQIERENNERIEKEREETNKRIQELVQSAADIEYSATHSAIEKQIRDIEIWKEEKLGALKDTENAQQEALAVAVNAYAREREAFEREIDRIKGKTQDLYEKIFAQEHSQQDVDVLQAQKERAQLYQEGIYDPDTIERWYQNELDKIAERATESFRTNQGAYSQAPRRRGESDGFQLIEGGEVTGGAPIIPPDFYGDIQAQTDKAMERFGVLADSTQAVTDAQSNFVDVFKRESERFAQVMQELSEKLSGSQFAADKADNQIATANQSAEDPLLNTTNAKTAFNVIANAGEVAALAGLATANPMLGLGGAATAAVGNVGSTAVEALEDYGKNQPELPTAPSADLSEFNSLIQGFQDEMSRLIGDFYETTKGIADNVNKISSQPPNITVSPTINVDLGGAYVFDNAMKAQLTDDITDKVADAVKSAVENGISQFSYGYGS